MTNDPAIPDPVTMLSLSGLVYASVCTSLPLDETLAFVNDLHPTGISTPWVVSDDETFATGEVNGCACEDHPATHLHYLLEC